MRPKAWSLLPVLGTYAGLTLLLSACNFTLASNSAATSPGPTVNVDYRSAQPEATLDDSPLDPAESITQDAVPLPREQTAASGASPAIQDRPQLALAPTQRPSGDSTSLYYRSGFACTGSMRPTIDCGDEGVFLKPPFEDAPEVGDIISFSSEPECRYYKNHSISKAHRIISVRTVEGANYYTTKGDATEKPDPCETTIDQIDGKLVEVRKGTRPQDVIDTSSYELAKEWVDLLKSKYDEGKAEFDRLKAEYDARGKQYQEMVASYKNGDTEYEVVLSFYRQLEAERTALNLRKDYLNSLAREINSGVAEVDRLYLELFIQ